MDDALVTATRSTLRSSTESTECLNLRHTLSLRLAHHGRKWSWVAESGNRGYQILKPAHFSYPAEPSRRKTSLPPASAAEWPALFGAACGLRAGTVAALVLAWQWEMFRARQLAVEEDGTRWPLGTSLADAFDRHPPSASDHIRFEANRAAIMERDLIAAFGHHATAIAREYGPYRSLASRLARWAVAQRLHTKPVFAPDGGEAQHLTTAPGISDGPRERTFIVSVPKTDAATALLRIHGLAYGVLDDPLTFDHLCDLERFQRRPLDTQGDGALRNDLLFQCGLVATYGDDMAAVVSREDGPLLHGLHDVLVPNPGATIDLARQVAAHPWRALGARPNAQLDPMALVLHRLPADIRLAGASGPDDGPLLLTFLWRARLDGREPPAAGQDGVRWKRLSDLLLSGLPDPADRVILSALRHHESAPRVLADSTAQLVFLANSECRAWCESWSAA